MKISLLWQEGSLTCSVSRGRFGLNGSGPFLYEECIGPVPPDCTTLQPCTDSHCRRDVSVRHTAICFPVCYVTWLFEVIVYSVSEPTYCCLSPSLSSDPPPLPSSHSGYFYECLQYLMEAKRAQQSLESTYKQLDSVSVKQGVHPSSYVMITFSLV